MRTCFCQTAALCSLLLASFICQAQIPRIELPSQISREQQRENNNNFLKENAYVTGTSSEFARIYRKTAAAMRSQDLEGMQAGIAEMQAAQDEENQLELFYTYAMQYWYSDALGDENAEVEALTASLALDPNKVPANLYVSAAAALYRYQLSNKLYGKARQTYYKISELPEAKDVREAMADTVAKIDEIAQATDPFLSEIKFKSDRAYSDMLLRRLVYFDEITGEITTVKITCEKKQAKMPFNRDAVINIPSSWGECEITIYGEANASMVMIQQQPDALLKANQD